MFDAVGALNSVARPGEQADTPAATNLGKEDFLNLLVTQIQNQDPLDPLKNEEFVAQMAQFSSLEQLININETMGQVQLLNSSINNSQALNLIGKNITVFGDTLQIADGSANDINYTVGDDADVTISIYDESGAIVRTVHVGHKEAGKHQFDFDGKDDDGNDLPDGGYRFVVKALDENGNDIGAVTLSNIRVDAVTFDQGNVYLISGESRYRLSDVIEVRED